MVFARRCSTFRLCGLRGGGQGTALWRRNKPTPKPPPHREQRRRGGGGELSVCWDLLTLLMAVTSGVRRLSVRKTNRRRLKRMAVRLRQERWEMVLLTKLKRDEDVKEGGGKGQQEWSGERVVAMVCLVTGGLRLVAAYQPSRGDDRGGVERCWRDMKRQIPMRGKERLVIGTWNSSMSTCVGERVGEGYTRRTVWEEEMKREETWWGGVRRREWHMWTILWGAGDWAHGDIRRLGNGKIRIDIWWEGERQGMARKVCTKDVKE